MSALRSRFVTQMQKCKYACVTAESEHCFDLSGLISAVGVTDIYSRPYGRYYFAGFGNWCSYKTQAKNSFSDIYRVE